MAWIHRDRVRKAADGIDPTLSVISFRVNAESGWEPEYLAVARSPEGDAALVKLLGLDARSSGWVRWSGALDEAKERGLCHVHQVPRSDGRYFVVARKGAAVEAKGAVTC